MQEHEHSSLTVNRRQLLQGAGGIGITTVAGCLGDSEDGTAPFQIQLEVNSESDDRVQIVELIASSLKESGYFETEVKTYEWNTYVERVSDPTYGTQGHVPYMGLSGTFNPGSFCRALHHSSNRGQCCNSVGINDPKLDAMIDNARYGVDVAEDTALRRKRYDEIWNYLAEKRYSSITHFLLDVGVMNTNVHGFSMFPFRENVFSYALHSPQDDQVLWMDEGADPRTTDLSDLTKGGTLRAGIGANVTSFDPPYSTDTTATLAQDLIFEQLVAADRDGNLYPWLAEDYELVETQNIERVDYETYMRTVDADKNGGLETDAQVIVRHPDDDPVADDEVRVLTPDDAAKAVADGVFGMQFRYSLHEGIEFHNGEELTAEHVVATVERYEGSKMESQTFDSLLHAEAVGDYTVDLYAQVPDAEAERELPGLYIHALEQADLEGGDLDPRQGVTPIGTGPYELSDFSDQEYVEYTKTDTYWLEELGLEQKQWFDGPRTFPNGPVIDELKLTVISEDSTRSAALQNGEIDLTYGLAANSLDEFDSADDFIVESVEAGGYEYIQYPIQVEPWGDKRLRQAINHLIPRKQIVDKVLNGWARPAWTPIPKLAEETGTADAEALEETLKPYNEYDPDRAAELLDAVIEDHGLA